MNEIQLVEDSVTINVISQHGRRALNQTDSLQEHFEKGAEERHSRVTTTRRQRRRRRARHLNGGISQRGNHSCTESPQEWGKPLEQTGLQLTR